MDEYEGRARRQQSASTAVLAAAFCGAVFGGGLAAQGQSLEAISADVRRVLETPALGADAPAPAPTWTPRDDPAQTRAELERTLTDAWPADRLMTASRPAAAATIHYALIARGAVLAAR